MTFPANGGRPFATLNLLPFLWLEQSDAGKLHSIYLKLSLQYHPDRIPPEKKLQREYVEERESIYSQINADYQDLKSIDRRIERVLSELKKEQQDAGSSKNRSSQLPPELALEYFEVIESPSLELVNSFEAKVTQQALLVDNQIAQLAQKFPFKGEGAFLNFPWTEDELKVLNNLQSQKKYLSNIVSEIAATKSRL